MFLGGGVRVRVRVRVHSYPVWTAEIPLKVLQAADLYGVDTLFCLQAFSFCKTFFFFKELMTSLCF